MFNYLTQDGVYTDYKVREFTLFDASGQANVVLQGLTYAEENCLAEMMLSLKGAEYVSLILDESEKKAFKKFKDDDDKIWVYEFVEDPSGDTKELGWMLMGHKS